MIRRPPRSTRTATLFPYTTLYRSLGELAVVDEDAGDAAGEADHRCDCPGAFGPACPLPQVVAPVGSVGLQAGRGREHAAGHSFGQLGDEGVAGVEPPGAVAVDDPLRPGVHVADAAICERGEAGGVPRSEEHTSELQSLMSISYAVFCLKKKNN